MFLHNDSGTVMKLTCQFIHSSFQQILTEHILCASHYCSQQLYYPEQRKQTPLVLLSSLIICVLLKDLINTLDPPKL